MQGINEIDSNYGAAFDEASVSFFDGISHKTFELKWNGNPTVGEPCWEVEEPQTKEFYSIIFSKNIEFYGRKLPSALLENFKKAGLKKVFIPA